MQGIGNSKSRITISGYGQVTSTSVETQKKRMNLVVLVQTQCEEACDV